MSGVSSAESSAQHPVNYPDNSRVLFGRRPGNGRIASEVTLANVRHNARSRIQSMASPRPVRARVISGKSYEQWPGNFRAVSEQLPGSISRNTCKCPHSGRRNSREASLQLPLESTKQFVWRTRSVQVGVQLTDRTAYGESSTQLPAQCS